MAITIAVNITGTPDEIDKRAALHVVENENTRRANDLDENGDPILPPLPTTPLGALATSYETMLVNILESAHADYRRQYDQAKLKDAKQLWADATDAQRQAAITALGG